MSESNGAVTIFRAHDKTSRETTLTVTGDPILIRSITLETDEGEVTLEIERTYLYHNDSIVIEYELYQP